MRDNWEYFIRLTIEKYHKVGSIACPAFKYELIYFRDDGIGHLLKKGGIPRTINEQKRKLYLFRYAIAIIETSIDISEYREIKNAKFWELTRSYADRIVSVVIRQQPGGSKHFFSIKDRKIKGTAR